MKFSVLMSVYKKDNPEWLKMALHSIFNQTILPNELVIVLDGAVSDEIIQVIREYEGLPEKFNMIPLAQNVGLGMALNIGLTHTTNELVARMDADDLSRGDRFEKQLDVFKKNGEVDIVSGSIQEFVETPEHKLAIRSLPEMHKDIVEFARLRSPFNHPAVMFKKSVVMAVGNYQDFPMFEDYHLWVRILKDGYTSYNLPDVLVYMRSGSELYTRRGGIRYLKQSFMLRKEFHKWGWIGFRQMMVGNVATGVVTLLPNEARKLMYKKLLRN